MMDAMSEDGDAAGVSIFLVAEMRKWPPLLRAAGLRPE
jgi:hypothetical protein